jgi:hypothetical protein
MLLAHFNWRKKSLFKHNFTKKFKKRKRVAGYAMRSQVLESKPLTGTLEMPLDATTRLEHNSPATFLSALAHPVAPLKPEAL